MQTGHMKPIVICLSWQEHTVFQGKLRGAGIASVKVDGKNKNWIKNRQKDCHTIASSKISLVPFK